MAGHSEAARRLVHLGAGSLACALKYLTVAEAALIAAGALVFNHLVLPRVGGEALFRRGERARPLESGIHLYPVAVLLLVLLFGWRMEVAAAGWVIMAAGDPAAAAVGQRLGGRPVPWNRRKTVAGSLAFAVASAAAGWAMLVYMGRPAGEAAALAIPTALFAAGIESLPWRLNDNLTVPLLSALFLCGLIAGDAVRLAGDVPRLREALLPAIVVNLALATLSFRAGAVDRSGVAAGLFVGVLTWLFGGWRSYLILIAFFVLGSATTRLGRRRKERLGVAQEKKGARSARHALANCGVGVYLALLCATASTPGPFVLAFACAYATAAFDTVSSEIGQAYGGRPVLITTLKHVPIGTDGAVTWIGTLAGFAGAALIAGLAAAFGLLGAGAIPAVLLASFVGSSADSVLGATLEQKGLMDNEAVNFSNTLIGALAGLLLASLGRA